MSQRVIQSSPKLAKAMKTRRQELGFTIEEAASKAGVGTKPGADMRQVNLSAGIRRKAFARH